MKLQECAKKLSASPTFIPAGVEVDNIVVGLIAAADFSGRRRSHPAEPPEKASFNVRLRLLARRNRHAPCVLF
jgi:hypothetical protein